MGTVKYSWPFWPRWPHSVLSASRGGAWPRLRRWLRNSPAMATHESNEWYGTPNSLHVARTIGEMVGRCSWLMPGNRWCSTW